MKNDMEIKDDLADLKEGKVANTSILVSRLKAAWRVLFEDDFILVNYRIVITPAGLVMKTRNIFRTDYNGEVDRSALQLAIETSEELNKKKTE